MRRGWRQVFDRHLVQGLTTDERIARLEGVLFGVDRVDSLEQRIEDAEENIVRLEVAAVRRRPFWRRWLRRSV